MSESSNKAGFPQKKKVQPTIKSRSTAKSVQVPKSANYKTSSQGDWGKASQ